MEGTRIPRREIGENERDLLESLWQKLPEASMAKAGCGEERKAAEKEPKREGEMRAAGEEMRAAGEEAGCEEETAGEGRVEREARKRETWRGEEEGNFRELQGRIRRRAGEREMRRRRRLWRYGSVAAAVVLALSAGVLWEADRPEQETARLSISYVVEGVQSAANARRRTERTTDFAMPISPFRRKLSATGAKSTP